MSQQVDQRTNGSADAGPERPGGLVRFAGWCYDHRRLVLGMGVNVNNSLADSPPEIQSVGTALCDATGLEFDLTQVLLAWLARFDEALQALAEGRSGEAIERLKDIDRPERIPELRALHLVSPRLPTDEALGLARALAASQQVRFGGIECYEGGVAKCDSDHDIEAVTSLVRRVVECVKACDAEQLFAGDGIGSLQGIAGHG